MSASTRTDSKAPAILKKVDPAPWKEAPSFSTTEVSVGSRRKYVISSKENPYLVVVVFHHGSLRGQFYRNGLGIPRFNGSRRLGKQQPSQLGLGYRQLRFLDWYWPCRNPYLGCFVSSETKMENFDQPGFEAMTVFAVLCAGIFPLFHAGRVWFAWWLFPLPNANAIWPQFRSPLEWDVFAVSTYATVSILFGIWA